MYKQSVNMADRQAMISFLSGHYRYHTMNSWNRSTSYAHCVKLGRLGLTSEQMAKAWTMYMLEEVHQVFNDIIFLFRLRHDNEFNIGFNGRSSGYLVLAGERNGSSMDQDADWEEYDEDALRARVELVCDFDDVCDDIRSSFISFLDNFDAVEETVMVPKKVTVLRERDAALA